MRVSSSTLKTSSKSVSVVSRFTAFLVAALIASAASSVGAADTSSANIWIEAESAQTNFEPGTTVMAIPDGNGASDGKYLRLYLQKNARVDSEFPYYAEYKFSVPVEGDYRFWISASPQNAAWASPFYFSLDGGIFTKLQGKVWAGKNYGDRSLQEDYFGWLLADTLNLKPGSHTLRFEVRGSRAIDNLYATFIDALLLTTDKSFVPAGNRPKYSSIPQFSDIVRQESFEGYRRRLERDVYFARMKNTSEEIGESSRAEVMRKIMARPLQSSNNSSYNFAQFGLHGMEAPFVLAGKNEAKTDLAYEMLARVGIQSLRTSESTWHRLSDNFAKFSELDYQAAMASKYKMNLMLVLGYPPAKYNVAPSPLSTFKPQYEQTYRQYLKTVFSRYKGKFTLVELGNEVDAPTVWFLGATPELYVRDARITQEELKKIDPNVKVAAFAATKSRNEKSSSASEGQGFVRKAFELGIDKYVDAYSLHYTWPMSQRGFPAFFRQEISKINSKKPLINSEETTYGKPSDILKVFARDLFLYKFESVYYFLSKDFFERSNLLYSGLFDIDWNPKLRLLPYALAVDSMKDRELVGISEPVSGVEAYVLKYLPRQKGNGSTYSIIMWRNNKSGGEFIGPVSTKAEVTKPSKVGGLSEVTSAFNWRLDPLPISNTSSEIGVGEEPVVVFTNRLPSWKIMSPVQWLESR